MPSFALWGSLVHLSFWNALSLGWHFLFSSSCWVTGAPLLSDVLYLAEWVQEAAFKSSARWETQRNIHSIGHVENAVWGRKEEPTAYTPGFWKQLLNPSCFPTVLMKTDDRTGVVVCERIGDEKELCGKQLSTVFTVSGRTSWSLFWDLLYTGLLSTSFVKE